ncbi:hypothetical protein [Vibrio nigripulchritudo]|uniref:hypothetical protein n=1 Tax=Vibrio nigripulchritudo TaxID=28173 RepID=UPI00249236D1|nr:hypothetical protein [Vibrio nigripulchritudo]BDU39975.1 hypothetical protein TUMSATVNIG2_44440 [Vibrio nigripulchritudo]BDU45699.1 hypothetical protein TUMSATVNIG3_44970 [Vibrio nigripulchritudo]
MSLSASLANFDSSDGYGPSLFFEGDEIAKHVPKFQHKVTLPTGSEIFENLMVNLTKSDFEIPALGNKKLKQSKELKSLYFHEGTSQYDWLAFQKNADGYEYWGSCDSDSGSDYTCLRSAKINDVYASYFVSNYNIRHYQQIEAFLGDWLNSQRCK